MRGVRVGQAQHPGPDVSLSEFLRRASSAVAAVPSLVDVQYVVAAPGAAETGPMALSDLQVPRFADGAARSTSLKGVRDRPPMRRRLDEAPTPPAHAAQSRATGPDAVELRCPFCERYRTRGAARNLVLHLVRSHAGEPLGPDLCAQLGALDRGICAHPGCGAVRLRSSDGCKHSSRRGPVRPARPEDTIPGELEPAVADPLAPAGPQHIAVAMPPAGVASGSAPVLP